MRRRSARAGLLRCALAVAAGIVASQVAARADVASDQPAAILVFPKVVVDTSMTPQISPPAQIDTLIRVSNTSSDHPVVMHCFYVDATPQCSTDLTQSCLSSPIACSPPTACKTTWQEVDFDVYLTPNQPVAWLASSGAGSGSCLPSDLPCFHPQNGTPNPSLVPPAGQDPFLGELKCIEVDQNFVPVNQNDLKGEAEIIRSSSSSIDVETYNAIGIAALAPPASGNTNTLTLGPSCVGGKYDQLSCLVPKDCQEPRPCKNPSNCNDGVCSACPPGEGCSAEYTGCPNILVLDHFFDGAPDPVSTFPVTTDLTLVPCSEDFSGQAPITTTVQFLVFNEFEQRLSTSTPVTCFQELKLSDIDAPVRRNALRDKSIFSAAVFGTLTGQTRLRGVPDGQPGHGNTLLGIAEEFRQGGGTAAVNLHFQGTRSQSDFIYLPQQ
jgi:hypothetical protein